MFIFMLPYYLQVYFLFYLEQNFEVHNPERFGTRRARWVHRCPHDRKRTGVSFFLPQIEEKRMNRTSVWGRVLEMA